MPQASPKMGRPRLDSIDLLRGLIMVVMALDHTRDFFSNARIDPLDLERTSAALFLTRWFTHFCAPNFIFLAGVGAFLTGTRGKSKKELSWFLLTRGLWLVLLNLTWERWLGFEFGFGFDRIVALVLWSIGWSMVVLAGLVFLPLPIIAVFGVGMIGLHNTLDSIHPQAFGQFGMLWGILHEVSGYEFLPGRHLFVLYPLIPWIGVLAAGYSFGVFFQWEPERRRRLFWQLGLALIALFIVLRGLNGYGNPTTETLGRPVANGQWSVQRNWLWTVFSFIDVHKYPPSLDFLLMTIGPALIILAWFERSTPRWLRPFLVFGRVPLFYYLVHLPLIHVLAMILAWIRHGTAAWLINNPMGGAGPAPPPNAGVDLPFVYLAWIGVVLILYPVCLWFSELKRRRKDAWLSYL